LGPGLDYNFLCFNLTPGNPKQVWFGKSEFRQALSLAVDREAIAKLVFDGRAEPIWGHVTPGNKQWFSPALPRRRRSVANAKALLSKAGFAWNGDGRLIDRTGTVVEFSILVSSSSADRNRMATILQADFKDLGITVTITPIEFRSLLDRVLNTRQFDTTLMGLGGGSADPNAEMNVWLSSGAMHLWNPNQTKPATAWEGEIDHLMQQQAAELNAAKRRTLYENVQRLVAEQVPMIFLATPNVLAAARPAVGNFRPSVLEHTTLWNSEELFLAPRQTKP
jgi:peptide/nickel transport system substrate-binding protein